MELGVVLGVVAIGFVHGVLPDHGWPIAATYALTKRRRWLAGTVAALILGVGHLVSSVALVAAYFWIDSVADFADGPWLGYVAGTVLILLGIHEYRHGGHGHDDHEHGDEGGRDHGHRGRGHGQERGDGAGHDREHERGSHEHEHDSHDHEHERDARGIIARVREWLPGTGGHRHLHEDHADRGLAALGTTALLLGFAHEEPIQILAICGGAGTERCLELMLVYSLAVIVAIVAPTLLLIAGYERHRERIERYTPYLPTVTAVVLIGMGLAFIVGFV